MKGLFEDAYYAFILNDRSTGLSTDNQFPMGNFFSFRFIGRILLQNNKSCILFFETVCV